MEVLSPPPKQSRLPIVQQSLYLQSWDDVKPHLTFGKEGGRLSSINTMRQLSIRDFGKVQPCSSKPCSIDVQREITRILSRWRWLDMRPIAIIGTVYRMFDYSFILGIFDSLGFRIFVLALLRIYYILAVYVSG